MCEYIFWNNSYHLWKQNSILGTPSSSLIWSACGGLKTLQLSGVTRGEGLAALSPTRLHPHEAKGPRPARDSHSSKSTFRENRYQSTSLAPTPPDTSSRQRARGAGWSV